LTNRWLTFSENFVLTEMHMGQRHNEGGSIGWWATQEGCAVTEGNFQRSNSTYATRSRNCCGNL